MFDKKVSIIGTGYVGLPAAMMLARNGVKVLGVDLNPEIVNAINNRKLHFSEEDLNAVIEEPEVGANLRASSTVEPADIFVIAVPTPVHHTRKVADLTYVVGALESICPVLKKGDLIIIESTIPPLTCKTTAKPLIEKLTGLSVPEDIMLSHCPERIQPGRILQEIVGNDRIIGGVDERSAIASRSLYEVFVTGELFVTDDVTAEMCKLMENTYRDINIALANELAEVCNTLGIDWRKAFALSNRHPRVDLLNAGIGVGGHCIPIDPWFIHEVDPLNATIIEASRRINDARPGRIAGHIRKAVAGVEKPRIIALGATYKANTDDVRESPAIEVVHLLQQDGYRVEQYDPFVPEMRLESVAAVAKGADAVVVLVPHNSFMQELRDCREQIVAGMNHPIILEF